MTDRGLGKDAHAHLLAHHGDFANFAEVMVETHAGRFDPVFWAFLTSSVRAPKRIVDFGTGPGLLLAELAERFEGADIVGVEAQPDMLVHAAKIEAGNDRIHLVEQDLSAPPLDIEPGVDVIIASMVGQSMTPPAISASA